GVLSALQEAPDPCPDLGVDVALDCPHVLRRDAEILLHRGRHQNGGWRDGRRWLLAAGGHQETAEACCHDPQVDACPRHAPSSGTTFRGPSYRHPGGSVEYDLG